MVLQANAVDLAECAKAVGLMAWIPPAHSGAGAKLGEAEATLEAFILVGDKPVVEVDAMGDEHPVAHELHKTVGHFRKERRTANHVIGDPGQPGDVGLGSTVAD